MLRYSAHGMGFSGTEKPISCQMVPLLKRIEGDIHFRESVYLECILFVNFRRGAQIFQKKSSRGSVREAAARDKVASLFVQHFTDF